MPRRRLDAGARLGADAVTDANADTNADADADTNADTGADTGAEQRRRDLWDARSVPNPRHARGVSQRRLDPGG